MSKKKGATDAPEQVKLALSKIKLDKDLQPRQSLTQEAVAEYAESMTEGAQLPPCVVVYDGKSYWCCDGFHRIAAAKRIARGRDVARRRRQSSAWSAPNEL
jgi:uncharacterized ParB-like nuclease family protein